MSKLNESACFYEMSFFKNHEEFGIRANSSYNVNGLSKLYIYV